MNKEISSDYLTYQELTIAVETDKADNPFRSAAEFLMRSITDWPALNLQEPKDLIEEVRKEVKAKLTFHNLESYYSQLDLEDKDAAWKKKSLSSLLEVIGFERKSVFNKETELETIIKKLTEHYRLINYNL